MFGLKKSNKLAVQTSGELLVADFHSALINLVTMDAAQAEAKQSEANVTGALKYANNSANGVFVTAGDIAPNTAEYVMKNSVDAHLKKVQSEQIANYTMAQVSQLQEEDLQKYKGRKVRITKLDKSDTFVPLYADKHTGQLRKGTYNGQSVTGTIDDISFEQNVIVVRPNLTMRTLAPDRKYFLAYIVSMDTMLPAVKIDLI